MYTEQRRFYLKTSKDSSEGEGNLLFWEKKDAMKKASKCLGIIWFGGLISVFIPLVHFISVPTSLIAGPFLAFLIYRLHYSAIELKSGKAACPDCKQTLDIAFVDAKSPMVGRCGSCQTRYEVSLQIQ